MRFQKPFQWKEVTQFENRLCNPPILAIRKIKTWLFKVRMRVFYGKKCKPCVLAQLYPFTLPIKALQKRKPLHKNRATCKP
jgi:hypothetical protein